MTIFSSIARKPGQKPTVVDNSNSTTGATTEGRKTNRRGEKDGGHCWLAVIIIVLVGFGIPAVSLYSQYGLDANLHTYHDGDQVLVGPVSTDLNSRLCEAYIVTAGSSSQASIYLTDGPARISTDRVQSIHIQNSGLRAGELYDYRGFYLLPGSKIQIMACMSVFNRQPMVHAEILFIKGDNKYNHWRDDASCGSCVSERVTISPDKLCEAMRGVIVTYTVMDADTYYIIVTRQHHSDDVSFRAVIDMQITKTEYDTSRPKEMCVHAGHCKLNLTYGADDDVIVEFPFPDFSLPGSVAFFTTDCRLRKTFWLTVFAAVPGGLIGLAVALRCCDALCTGKGHSKEQKKKKEKAVFTVSQNTP